MQETGFRPDRRRSAYSSPVILNEVKNLVLLPFPGIKVEILRHYVPQNDSGELFDKLEFGVLVVSY